MKIGTLSANDLRDELSCQHKGLRFRTEKLGASEWLNVFGESFILTIEIAPQGIGISELEPGAVDFSAHDKFFRDPEDARLHLLKTLEGITS